MADVDLFQPPRPTQHGSDRDGLLQRALDCALVLIRRLRDLDRIGKGPPSTIPC